MKNGKDWMPGSRSGKLDMARNWLQILRQHGAEWKVPVSLIDELEDRINDLQEAHDKSVSNKGNKEDAAVARRLTDELEAALRFLKNRHFFI